MRWPPRPGDSDAAEPLRNSRIQPPSPVFRQGRVGMHIRCRARNGVQARAVQAGNLSVNSNSSVRYWTPFGGYKESGLGRELGPDALDAFTETKNVFIATD